MKPRVKIVSQFTPPKFAVIYRDWDVELFDTIGEAVDYGNGICRIKAVMREALPNTAALIDALDAIFPEPVEP